MSGPAARVIGRAGLTHVAATTDVHSRLDRAGALAAGLWSRREQGALVADCGDFLEGSGYYVLGGGQAEAALLAGLYDVIAPGNHGYARHAGDAALRALTVCANVTGPGGELVWAPLALASIGGKVTAVTAVLGEQAFASTPPADRAGHQLIDPAAALHAVHERWRGRAQAWVVLSHAGLEHDLGLAAACPFADVIFAGHCHDPRCGPVRAGGAVVVKGAELGAGYATARPAPDGWAGETCLFPAAAGRAVLPGPVAAALAEAGRLGEQLAGVLGPVRPGFARRTPGRGEVLARLAPAARQRARAGVVMLNDTCLREVPLGGQLRAGDLLGWEPFGNMLSCLITSDVPALAGLLADRAGPVTCWPVPLPPPGVRVRVAVTDYLAATYLHGTTACTPVSSRPVSVREVLRGVLLDPPGCSPAAGDTLVNGLGVPGREGAR